MKYQEINKNIERMSKYTKIGYILKKVVFQRFLVISILLTAINLLFEGTDSGLTELVFISIIKVGLVLIVGIIVGNLEWVFYELLKSNQHIRTSEIRNRFITNVGILSWGLPIGICYTNYPITSVVMISLGVLIWTVSGLLFGIIMWTVVAGEFEKFMKSKCELTTQD